jgi:hypothetical protein
MFREYLLPSSSEHCFSFFPNSLKIIPLKMNSLTFPHISETGRLYGAHHVIKYFTIKVFYRLLKKQKELGFCMSYKAHFMLFER